MATIEAALFTRVSTHVGLSALVGTRIYPGLLPQAVTLPAISYFRVSTNRSSKMGVDSQVVQSRWQFDLWGAKGGYTATVAARNQLRLALQRWRNASSPVVQDTFILDEQDLVEDTPDSLIVHHLTLDAEIWFDE